MFANAVPGADARVTYAWQQGLDGDGVTVAVVDTDIDATQPDLADRIAPDGADLTQPDGCPDGIPNHGTQVAGVVAADRDNATGIAGVAPAAKILPVRALDNCGGGSRDWVVQGLTYAADQGAPIVVGSFAGDPNADPATKA